MNKSELRVVKARGKTIMVGFSKTVMNKMVSYMMTGFTGAIFFWQIVDRWPTWFPLWDNACQFPVIDIQTSENGKWLSSLSYDQISIPCIYGQDFLKLDVIHDQMSSFTDFDILSDFLVWARQLSQMGNNMCLIQFVRPWPPNITVILFCGLDSFVFLSTIKKGTFF